LDDFEDDERLVQELGVDSMMALEIVACIERKYKIRIPEERLVEVQTLNDSVRLTLDAITEAK
ncbi:acyl carrier protein, partial [Fangia hongkongensis]